MSLKPVKVGNMLFEIHTEILISNKNRLLFYEVREKMYDMMWDHTETKLNCVLS